MLQLSEHPSYPGFQLTRVYCYALQKNIYTSEVSSFEELAEFGTTDSGFSFSLSLLESVTKE